MIKELHELDKHWATKKGLHKTDPKIQALKLVEEVGELANALLRDNERNILDALGDIQVVMIILHQQLGIEPDATLHYAYEQIKHRTGKIKKGVFIKTEEL